MKNYNFYFIELIIRFIYVFISYSLCFFMLFIHIDVIFLFEVYPFISLLTRRFIVTQITDFVDVIWYLLSFFSFLFTYPLTLYHFNSFLFNSWKKYQIIFFTKLSNNFFFFFFFFYLLNHVFLLFNILIFFLQWEYSNDISLLRIESEITILSYITWVLLFKTSFSMFISWFFFKTLLIYFFIDLFNLYNFIKLYKSMLIFIFIFFIFILTPPDFFLQLFSSFFIFIFFDFWFFFLCIKFYKLNTTNDANYLSVT
uniref:Preprotein translocase subunit SecY n=1 Tax=Synarthrophyton chejuense TaxID=2485825 RepID=A0A3G3MIH8_9FLOR|nr:preprotein translocase subunit SecY [Synarthrophyton chejuense]AYR06630.1 preprotein translocase subunit SecY [Synarthrophyton chejuense]